MIEAGDLQGHVEPFLGRRLGVFEDLLGADAHEFHVGQGVDQVHPFGDGAVHLSQKDQDPDVSRGHHLGGGHRHRHRQDQDGQDKADLRELLELRHVLPQDHETQGNQYSQ